MLARFSLALVLAFGVPALAQTAAPAKKQLRYLTAEDLNPALFVPAPPKDGTPEQVAGVAETLAIQTAASEDRKARAVWDDRHESIEFYERYLPGGFSFAKLPLTAALLKEAHDEGDIAADFAKVHFDRKRPWAFNEAISNCEEKGRNSNTNRAYPSGHGTLAYSTGVVFAHLMPARAAEILAVSKDYAFSRVVCGSHYTSDILASEVIGTTTAELLLHNAAFKAKFDAAKAELVAAGMAQ